MIPITKGLRIAFVTTHPPSTGSLTEYAFYFTRSLAQKAEVAELHMLVDELPSGEQYEDFGTVKFRPTWRFGDVRNALRIRNAVREIQPDFVLFNIQFASFGQGKVPAALGLAAPALVKQAGFPTMVLLHNIMETVDLNQAGFGGNPIMETAIRTFGTVATRMLLQSDYVALTIPKYVEILQEKYGVDNVLLAPHGSFDDSADIPNFNQQSPQQKIMTFGKFGTYKKVESLIEAFKLIKNNGHPQAELVIAGSNSPNAPLYLENIQAQYADVPDITYTGYVAEEDVPRIFTESSVVVFPYTATTGSSGVLHQAGDYGKAVVLPNIGDFAEVITEEGYTGEFFEPNDPQALANAITKLLDDDELRRNIGQQNFMASRGIPIDSVVDWYLIHMQTLLAEHQPELAPV